MAGFYTAEIRSKGFRVGFELCGLNGRRRTLAHVDIRSQDRVGKYRVDTGGFEEFLETLGLLNPEVELVVIDEIGKMEMLSEKFCEIVIEALDSDKPIMVTLHKKSRTPLLQDIRRRDDIRILEVTAVNRNLLPYKIEKIMAEKLPPLF